jgi:hypothetical protein
MSKIKTQIIVKCKTVKSFSLTEDQVYEACVYWVEKNNGVNFAVKPHVELNISSDGIFYSAEITTITETEDVIEK